MVEVSSVLRLWIVPRSRYLIKYVIASSSVEISLHFSKISVALIRVISPKEGVVDGTGKSENDYM